MSDSVDISKIGDTAFRFAPLRSIAFQVVYNPALNWQEMYERNPCAAMMLELIKLYPEDERLREIMDRYDCEAMCVHPDGRTERTFETALAKKNRESNTAYQ